MERREFLRMARAAGVVIAPWALIPEAQAQAQGVYAGRILINVHADGGLDQSSWADPRERDGTINSYAAAGTPAGVAGNIRFAPMANNAAFFAAHSSRMLVINGVHSETNDHGSGARAHATGRLDMGYPNVSEVFAYTYGKNLPMAWLNSGGFSRSAGLMPATPVPDLNAFRALGAPNAASATNDFMKQADLTRAQAARAERMKALQTGGTLTPRNKVAVEEFLGASNSRALLQRVASVTPAQLDSFGQANVALLAAQAGLATTVQLATGGFDSHSNHDNAYANALPRLTNLVDYLWQKSADLGLSNRLFVRIYSEFGRTALNSGNGKDHWEVGTQILMEAAPPWGNRVVGASGPKHQALKISPSTGKEDAAAGFVIRPRHVHAAMRKYLGIDITDPRFDLRVPAAEMFDFFNPALVTGYPNL
jgi:hypothetical protein